MTRRILNRHFTRQLETTTYTVPFGLAKSPEIDALFCNTDTKSHEVRVYEVPNGLQPTQEHLVIDWSGEEALRPKETRPAHWKTSMKQGDTLRVVADTAEKVTVGFEIDEADW